MAWTQDDIDALKSAIKRGVRSVTNSDGTSVTYGTTDDMVRVLKLMESEVNGTSRRPASYSVAGLSKART